MSGILDISNLLSTIYGGPNGSGLSTDPVGDLTRAEASSTRDIKATAAKPEVARDVAAFRSAVASAKDPATLLRDPTVLKVLLTANGLGDQAQYPALAQKALLSNTKDSHSLADQLPNSAWKATASTYDFANKGLTIIQNPSVLDTLANGYAEVLWRQSLDKTTPGLSNALTFRDKAAGITSVDQILGDSTLRTVVTTALGIPLQIAYQGLHAEEQSISTRLDITQFKDRKFVEQFAQRYLIQNNLTSNGGSSPAATTTALSAFGYTAPTDTGDAASNTLASLVVKSGGLIV